MQPGEPTETQEESQTEETPDQETKENTEPGEGEEPKEGEPQEEESQEETPGEDKSEEAKHAQPDAEEKRKRAGGWQRKIERLERERQLLMEQLQRTGQPPPASRPDKEKTPEERAAEYIDNLVEQRLTRREQERQAQTAQAEFQRRTAEVRQKHPDFEDVVMSAADVPVSQAVTEALLTSEHGPEIMYQLASSPAELARLSALPPLAAAREIGRLEAKLASSTPPPVKPKPAFRPPAPPTSVNGSTSNTRSLEDLPISEYKRAYRSGRR